MKLAHFFQVLLAPVYFHLGHYSLVIDILVLGGEIVDTVGVFFLLFFFLFGVIFYKNVTFQTFAKSFFKNYIATFNTMPFLDYVSFIFKSFLKFISFLVKKIWHFFTKRK